MKPPIRLFNLCVTFCNRWNKIKPWGMRLHYDKLVYPYVMDEYSHRVLRGIHDLYGRVCHFNHLSFGNCGLHNTAVHKMTLMYCVAAVRGTGEVPFLNSYDNECAKWALDAWEQHTNGKCVDGELPEKSVSGRIESYCPFCSIDEELCTSRLENKGL